MTLVYGRRDVALHHIQKVSNSGDVVFFREGLPKLTSEKSDLDGRRDGEDQNLMLSSKMGLAPTF